MRNHTLYCLASRSRRIGRWFSVCTSANVMVSKKTQEAQNSFSTKQCLGVFANQYARSRYLCPSSDTVNYFVLSPADFKLWDIRAANCIYC